MKNEIPTTDANGIQYIHIDQLNPHPDNPRKDVGDVTELAESIKANGILQNLTVVPYEGGYRVIIGHRRLTAAKMAGIEVLPCVVVEMTEKDQIHTMLTENMQRVDLTIYEQAQGFQMMLDMGDSMDEIADKSGFSKTTVRKRLEIAKLDGAALKKATDTRQITMADFDKLAEVEDIEARNRLLSSIGTPNFKNDLSRELQNQKTKHRIAEWLVVVKTFATEIQKDDIDRDKMNYVRNYSWYRLTDEVQIPEDAAEVKYYYIVCSNEIDIYKERDAEKEEAEQNARDERLRKDAEEREKWRDINDRHFDLRMEFVRNLSNSKCKKHFAEICLFLADAVKEMSATYYNRPRLEIGTFAYCMCVPFNEDDVDEDCEIAEIPDMNAAIEAEPEKAALCIAYSGADNEKSGYWAHEWNSEKRIFEYVYKANDRLDAVYDMLTSLGYEMSDEEKQMQNGNHEAFATEEG